jgi:sugar phosphate isomerase/epimerase
MDMSMFSLGVNMSYYGDLGFDGSVARLSHLGFHNLDLMIDTNWIQSKEKVRSIIDILGSYNMRKVQCHAPPQVDISSFDENKRNDAVNFLNAVACYCAKLGIETLVVHPAGGDVDCGARDDNELGIIKENHVKPLMILGAVAKDLGIRIALENIADRALPRGLRWFGSYVWELRDLLDALESEALGICLDTGHLNAQGMQVDLGVRETGRHLIATHIHDNVGLIDSNFWGAGKWEYLDQHLPPGWGSIDWKTVLNALREVGYRGVLTLELNPMNLSRTRYLPLELRDQMLLSARALLQQN